MPTSEDNPRLPVLKEKVADFPKLPGVYLMRDIKGEVIYIGKAKSLRERVRSYFSGGDGRFQIEFLLRRIHDIENIITDSEDQAFVLERDLITKHKPRYNIRLKDDRAFLSIRIDENDPWPRLELVRRVENDGAKYFGPYTYSYELKTVMDVIKKVVPLRTCSNTVFYNRQRPCLEYQIKRCAGPCCLEVDPDDYKSWIRQAISILEGKTAPIVKQLTRIMEKASDELRFEDAALYRDRIQILENFSEGLKFVSTGGENRDVFSIYREEGLATLSVLQVRNGRISGNSNYSFSDVAVSTEEVLESALEQYYGSGREVPEEIVLPCELENEDFLVRALREKRGAAFSFAYPKRGIKFRLLGLAEVNAKQHFLARFDAEQRYSEISKALAKMLSLRQIPRRIECLDISNFQGSDIVGAIISFMDGEADKSAYKKYRISHQGKPDDFFAIHEVVSRRIKRGIEEDNLPDLLIIDGGKGQLSSALTARDEQGSDLEIVSLAKMRNEKGKGLASNLRKKPERLFIEGSTVPIIPEPDSELTRFLQRVRDEAHRFVITYHRNSRAKRSFGSILDEIPGIGPERRKRLLRAYGSIDQMRKAAPEDLAREGRMSKLLAEKVLRTIAK